MWKTHDPQEVIGEIGQRGLRRTRQREAVIRAVFDPTRSHATAEEIHREATRHLKGIGIATVYRTLRLMVRMGIVSYLNTGDGKARYEPNHGLYHHHVVCIRCGLLVEIPNQPDSFLESNETGFAITGSSVCYFGYCPQCVKGYVRGLGAQGRVERGGGAGEHRSIAARVETGQSGDQADETGS